MDINLLYKAILESLYLTSDENGLISMNINGVIRPCELDNKRMVLPTREILRDADWKHMVAFHPLSENILRGESAVIKKIRMLMNLRIMTVTTTLMYELLELAVDHDKHKKLSAAAMEFLRYVPAADEKTIKVLDKVVSGIDIKGDRRLVSVYLKRGGMYKGEKFSRVAITSFPITEQFETDEHEIFDVKMRIKDKESIANLFEYILPGSKNLETYSAGSNNSTAPYFHALCLSFEKVARRLNAVVDIFKKHLEDADDLYIPLNWSEMIKDLSVYRDLVPTLAGNDGNVIDAAAEEEAKTPRSNNMSRLAEQTASFTTAPVQPIAPATEAPAQNNVYQPPATPFQPSAPKREVVNTGGGIQWDSIVATNPQVQGQLGLIPPAPQFQQFQQPMMFQQPQQPQYYPPQQFQPQPQYYQQPPMQPPYQPMPQQWQPQQYQQPPQGYYQQPSQPQQLSAWPPQMPSAPVQGYRQF